MYSLKPHRIQNEHSKSGPKFNDTVLVSILGYLYNYRLWCEQALKWINKTVAHHTCSESRTRAEGLSLISVSVAFMDSVGLSCSCWFCFSLSGSLVVSLQGLVLVYGSNQTWLGQGADSVCGWFSLRPSHLSSSAATNHDTP